MVIIFLKIAGLKENICGVKRLYQKNMTNFSKGKFLLSIRKDLLSFPWAMKYSFSWEMEKAWDFSEQNRIKRRKFYCSAADVTIFQFQFCACVLQNIHWGIQALLQLFYGSFVQQFPSFPLFVKTPQTFSQQIIVLNITFSIRILLFWSNERTLKVFVIHYKNFIGIFHKNVHSLECNISM